RRGAMQRGVGLLILLVVIGAVIGYKVYSGRAGATPGPDGQPPRPPQDVVTAHGPVGGEKLGFLGDPEVQKILRDKYGVTVDYTKAGSIEMVRADPAGDFLWPSSQVALELYRARKAPMQKAEIIFNSPIVLYSWDAVTDGLIGAGIVRKQADSYYVVDMPRLVRLIVEGKGWKEIGVPQLYGRISIFTTDPTKSSSGNLFAGLLANLLNGGEVVNESSLPKVQPTLKKFFDRLGFLEQSSE